MIITAFNGSPRGKESTTYVMVESFLAGAREAGAETEQVLLAEKQIAACKGCFACWLKTPGKCVINDDMPELLKKIAISDIIVFATPLYVFNVTGIMKNFMDRMIAAADPHFEQDENGASRHIATRANAPKIVAISNCGFPEQVHFKVLHSLFEVLAHHMHTELIAEIYRGEGALLTNAPLLLKPLVHHYKKLLEEAGKQVVKYSKLSEELVTKLNKPLVPIDMYIKEANKQFDKILQQQLKDKNNE
jgi:multimeric flavodoxin WrbA